MTGTFEMRLATAAVLALALVGCATQPPVAKQTQSGKAEATFRNITPERMKSELALICTKTGGQVQSEQFAVVCSKQDTGTSGMVTQALMGNRFSQAPWERLRFNIVPVGADVFVTAEAFSEMSMGFGEVKHMPNTSNAMRNQLQAALDAASARWSENGGQATGTPPTSAPTSPASDCEACKKIGGG